MFDCPKFVRSRDRSIGFVALLSAGPTRRYGVRTDWIVETHAHDAKRWQRDAGDLPERALTLDSSLGLTLVSAASAGAAWVMLRTVFPGHDLLVGLIAAWAVVFRLWQRSPSDNHVRTVYFVIGIILLVAALVVTIAR
jgi:hypothetical protein